MKESLNILNAVTIGATAVYNSNPTRTDLTARAWDSITLQTKTLNGGTAPTTQGTIDLYYAFSDESINPTTASVVLYDHASVFKHTVYPLANDQKLDVSVLVPITGDYFYSWTTCTGLGVDVVLTFDIVQGLNETASSVSTITGTVEVTQNNPDSLHASVVGTVAVSNLPATQAISAVSLPLPTGASTSSLQTTGNNSLSSIDNKLSTGVSRAWNLTSANDSVTVAGTITSTPSGTQNSNITQISGSAVTLGQKVSASAIPVVVSSDYTIPISATSLPLPAGASTSANQSTGNSSLSSIDGKIPVKGAATIANSSPVNIASDQVVPISATSLPLPTGASTSANQTTGNSSLSSIDGKLTSGVARSWTLASGTDSVTIAGTVTSTPSGTQTVAFQPSTTVSGAAPFTSTQTLAANNSRVGAYISNRGTDPIVIEYGSSGTGQSMILNPSSLVDYGDGGWRFIEHWKGALQVRLFSGSSLKFDLWEVT